MNSIYQYIILLFFAISINSCSVDKRNSPEKSHPFLILQKSSIPELNDGITKYPLLKSTFDEAKKFADEAILDGIKVPVPKDAAGGYTHVQHSKNYMAMFDAGEVYQLTGDKKYAAFVRDMLLAYAKLYPTLGIHPLQKNNAPGKLFWQGLNDAVWLVYTSQAYDCVYDFISESDRHEIESNLFERIVHFFTVEDTYTFNLIHNHGTWYVASVGLTGLVMNRPEWVEEALYGTKLDSTAGFLKQMNDLYSPDGYYAEGPYYQRYAALPALVFVQALENNRPELKIFDTKNGILTKEVEMLMQLTTSNNRFYPLNDVLKENNANVKSKISKEMLFPTNIVFARTGDKQLLDIAGQIGTVMLSKQGLEVARAYKEGLAEPFERKSVILRDGANGTKGGLAILRAGKEEDQSSLLLKYTSQGMGHGHFDRLSYCLYDYGNEVVSDYGSVRFSKVEAKDGGRYLSENNTWSKQTVAHNTVVVDEKSDFNGDADEASKFNPSFLFSDIDNKEFQIVSAVDSNCYKGVLLQRTMALVNNKYGRFIVDLFRVDSKDKEVDCDLPLYYQGQIMSTNFQYKKALTEMKVMGNANGYQHLWIESSANNLNGMASTCWMNDDRFYIWSFFPDKNSEFYFTRMGANDPNFNLRNEPGLMICQKKVKKHTFFSVLEMHGNNSPINEAVSGSKTLLESMDLIYEDENVTGIQLRFIDGGSMVLLVSHAPNKNLNHEVKINGVSYAWEGNYKLTMN